jgi:L-threonylcarbamoyladenylate synthase
LPEIINLKHHFEQALEKSIEILNTGGLIVFPTDTIYGLAAKYDNLPAIQRIYTVKDRDQTKALAVLVGNIPQVEEVSDEIPPNAKRLMEKFWPGALTIVLQKSKKIVTPLSLDNSIGIRIPDDRFVRLLSENIGPLATTSANKSGLPSTTNITEVLSQLGDLVDLIVDGGESPGGVASTVVDCRKNVIELLREGAISKLELLNL